MKMKAENSGDLKSSARWSVLERQRAEMREFHRDPGYCWLIKAAQIMNLLGGG